MANPSTDLNITRRQALGALAILGGTALTGAAPTAAALRPVPHFLMGKAGISVSRLAVGGWHAGVAMSESAGIRMLQAAADLGANFFDSAASYGGEDGSEHRLGKAFADRRDRVVLMSKSYERNRDGSRREFDRSLKRMQTRHIDLWQFHSINSTNDAEAIARPGGAAEMARAALKAGEIRVLGATSHNSPEGLLRLMELVPEIEVVQFPVNAVDLHWKSFLTSVMPAVRKRGIGVLAMKTLAMGRLAKDPIATRQECLRYALSQPVDVWVTGVETEAQLRENIAQLIDHTAMPEAEQTALLARTEPLKGPKTEGYKNW